MKSKILLALFFAGIFFISPSSEACVHEDDDGCTVTFPDENDRFGHGSTGGSGGGSFGSVGGSGNGNGNPGGPGGGGGASNSSNEPGESKADCQKRMDALTAKCHTLYTGTGYVTAAMCARVAVNMPAWGAMCVLARDSLTARSEAWCNSEGARRKAMCQ